jgi:hypothetical protein
VSTLEHGQRGLTLVEVALAAGIIAVGIAGLLATVPLSAYGIHEGAQLSTATFLAGQRLEQVRMAAWTATPPRDDLGVSPSPGHPARADGVTRFPDESPVAGPYGQYVRRVRVVDCGADAGCGGIVGEGLRQVTVTVSYTPLTGVGVSPASKSAVLSLLLARR